MEKTGEHTNPTSWALPLAHLLVLNKLVCECRQDPVFTLAGLQPLSYLNDSLKPGRPAQGQEKKGLWRCRADESQAQKTNDQHSRKGKIKIPSRLPSLLMNMEIVALS